MKELNDYQLRLAYQHTGLPRIWYRAFRWAYRHPRAAREIVSAWRGRRYVTPTERQIQQSEWN